MARLPYVTRDDLPADKQRIYDRIAEARPSAETPGEAPKIFRALLNSPDAAEAVARLGEYLRFNSDFDPAAREIAILSTAKELDSQYQWTRHESQARKAGVSEEVIQAIASGRAPMGIPAKDGVFAQAAKELVRDGTLTDRTFQAILHLLGPAQTVDLILIVGYYSMVAMVISALDVEP